MAKPPYVQVLLEPGAGQPFYDLTPYLTRESGSTMTSTIESPTELCSFTAPEVTLMGYDATGTVQGYFAGIKPTSADYKVKISLGIVDPTTGTTHVDVSQDCFVVPNTLQFDTVTKAFQFSIVGIAHLLATTGAETIAALNRTAASLAAALATGGYWPTKWQLQQDVTPYINDIQVTTTAGFSTKVCDFQGGDQISLGGNETFTVTGVTSDGANPPVYWTLHLNAVPQNKYTASSQIPVTLLTPYVRNISLQKLVAALFTAAGLPFQWNFSSAPLPFLTEPFASPVDPTGLPAGAVTGISPVSFAAIPQPLAAGTPGQVYQTTGPTAGFTPLAARAGPPVDPTNSGTTYVYTGQRWKLTHAGNPRFGLNTTITLYAYDPAQYGGTQNRYVLTLTCNADTAAAPYTFTTQLAWQSYTVGTDAWSAPVTLWAGINDTTSTPLDANDFLNGFGICVDTTGTIFFTDAFVASSGSPISFQLSSYQPTGATPATGTLTRARVATKNGQMTLLAPGVVGVFQTDGILGAPPNAFIYTVTGPGVMTLAATQPCSPYLIASSIKINRGDGRYYGLVSDPVTGVTLMRWLNSLLTPDTSWVPDVLFKAPSGPGTSALGSFRVDLVSPASAAPGTGAYPIFILLGGTIYYVSTAGSGVVSYADMTGLSVSDALSQLTVLNAGIFYLMPTEFWVFRSRNTPVPGDTIGTDDQLEHSKAIIALSSQNVNNLWVGYVSVTNENDNTIFGQAGDVAYSSAKSANTASAPSSSLELQCRFVPSSSFAAALALSLYGYLGAQKRVVSATVQRDGVLIYDVGRTFHLLVDGVNRQFQITQSQTELYGATTMIQALEV